MVVVIRTLRVGPTDVMLAASPYYVGFAGDFSLAAAVSDGEPATSVQPRVSWMPMHHFYAADGGQRCSGSRGAAVTTAPINEGLDRLQPWPRPKWKADRQMTDVDAVSAGAQTDVQSQLIPFGVGWALWPIAMLRSAGLPIARLLEFTEAVAEAGRDTNELCRLLERVAADPWLLEALSWQNPTIVNQWLLRYATEGIGEARHQPARYVHKLATVAAYIQRYATKNETIGFYGPCGWAVVDPSSDSAVHAPGGGIRVGHYEEFEPWTITALAGVWAADPEVRWYLPVSVNQAGLLDGDSFHRPRRRPLRLTPDQKAVLDELATAPDHATDLLDRLRASSGDHEGWSRDRLGPVLEALQKAECLWWGFNLPIERGLEQIVLAQLSRFPDGQLRSTLTEQLRNFSRLRDGVSRALGKPEKTIEAFNELGDAFEEATGLERTVLKAVNPHSRTLLYHDVVVDWGAVVGSRSLAQLSGPMELLLAVCRYVTWQLANEVDELARSALAEGDNSFEAVFDELAPTLLPEGSTAVSGKVMADVHAKVADLLAATEPQESTDSSASYRGAVLRQRWLDAFAAPRYGWTAARTHSPDIMLSIDGDRHSWVLGELHMAVNTLDYRFSIDSQPVPGQLEELIDAATSERYIPAFPIYWPEKTPRGFPPPAHHLPDKHRYWTLWSRSVVSQSIPKLSCVGLTVADRDGELVVLDATGERLARLADFIGEFLSLMFSSTFSLFPKGRQQQRVTIDSVVVQRRTWWLPARQLLAAGRGSLQEFFVSNGIPRHTFIRIPGERKPVFCDSHSSMMTRNLVRMLSKRPDTADMIQVQEVLPAVEHLWLRGPDGDVVTSEFRFVFQDLAGHV
jgi:hypothetical protein